MDVDALPIISDPFSARFVTVPLTFFKFVSTSRDACNAACDAFCLILFNGETAGG